MVFYSGLASGKLIQMAVVVFDNRLSSFCSTRLFVLGRDNCLYRSSLSIDWIVPEACSSQMRYHLFVKRSADNITLVFSISFTILVCIWIPIEEIIPFERIGDSMRLNSVVWRWRMLISTINMFRSIFRWSLHRSGDKKFDSFQNEINWRRFIDCDETFGMRAMGMSNLVWRSVRMIGWLLLLSNIQMMACGPSHLESYRRWDFDALVEESTLLSFIAALRARP